MTANDLALLLAAILPQIAWRRPADDVLVAEWTNPHSGKAAHARIVFDQVDGHAWCTVYHSPVCNGGYQPRYVEATDLANFAAPFVDAVSDAVGVAEPVSGAVNSKLCPLLALRAKLVAFYGGTWDVLWNAKHAAPYLRRENLGGIGRTWCVYESAPAPFASRPANAHHFSVSYRLPGQAGVCIPGWRPVEAVARGLLHLAEAI